MLMGGGDCECGWSAERQHHFLEPLPEQLSCFTLKKVL